MRRASDFLELRFPTPRTRASARPPLTVRTGPLPNAGGHRTRFWMARTGPRRAAMVIRTVGVGARGIAATSFGGCIASRRGDFRSRVLTGDHAQVILLRSLCRFSDAGSDKPSTRSGGRRLKSAKPTLW